jgi:hypothetical protein
VRIRALLPLSEDAAEEEEAQREEEDDYDGDCDGGG